MEGSEPANFYRGLKELNFYSECDIIRRKISKDFSEAGKKKSRSDIGSGS